MDEQDLREGLRALAVAAPPAPVDRAEASVERHVRMRRSRAALSVATVVALAVPAGLVATRTGTDRPAPVAGPTPIHLWADRSDPSLRAAADRAVADHRDLTGSVAPGHTARVLWSARVPETGDVAVVYAFCGEGSCSKAVLAHTDELKAMTDDDDPDSSSWSIVSREITDGVLDEPLSTYLRGHVSWGNGSPSNVLLVVGPPEATSATWKSEKRRTGTGGEGSLTRAGQAFVGNIGYVSAATRVVLKDGKGRLVGQGIVGDREGSSYVGSVPWMGDVSAPAGWTLSHASRSQLFNRTEGLRDFTIVGEFAVLVRCEGYQPLAVTVNGTVATVPCDEDTHRVDPAGPATAAGGVDVRFDGEPFTAIAYGVIEPEGR